MYFDHKHHDQSPRKLRAMYHELPEKVEEWFRGQRWIEDWLPPWVTEFYVTFSAEQPNDNADIQSRVDYNYRLVKFIVFPHWLMIEDHLQRKCLLHELAHAIMAPLQCWIEDLMDHALDRGDGWQAEMLRHEYNNRLEQVVCDMTEAMEIRDDRT
jgi:hypothetical protein